MPSKLLSRCPACNGKLKITSLTCADCGMELRGEFEPEAGLFPEISSEQREFLIVFLKCRGNMSQVQTELQMSYFAAKKRLDDVLLAMGLQGKEEIQNREVIDVREWKVEEGSVRASEIVKQKLKESGGRATITSYSGNSYEIWAEPDGKSFGCDALNTVTHTYDIFDIVVDFLEENGGRAKKGTGRVPLGSPNCGLDTVAGVILKDYSGVAIGRSGFDPSFVVIAVLAWAGILHNDRGEVRLTAQYRAMKAPKKHEVTFVEANDKLAHRFQEELKDKMFVAKRDYKYNPTRFNQMLAQLGGVATVKRLLSKAMQTGDLSEGFMKLYGDEGRPDLTAEYSVCKPEYAPLFTEEEIEFCKQLFME